MEADTEDDYVLTAEATYYYEKESLVGEKKIFFLEHSR